jgi:hypothetical protein
LIAERGGSINTEGAAAEDDYYTLYFFEGVLLEAGNKPANSAAVFISGLMAGLENAPLPAAWRTTRRRRPLDRALAWAMRNQPAEANDRTAAKGCGRVGTRLLFKAALLLLKGALPVMPLRIANIVIAAAL